MVYITDVFDLAQVVPPCYTCGGSGKIHEGAKEHCGVCGGSGRSPKYGKTARYTITVDEISRDEAKWWVGQEEMASTGFIYSPVLSREVKKDLESSKNLYFAAPFEAKVNQDIVILVKRDPKSWAIRYFEVVL